MRTLIRKSLKVVHTDRFASATEMADALGKVQIVNDWETKVSSTGEMRWRSRRGSKPDLVVDLLNRSGKWDVGIHGDGNGTSRKRSSNDWRTGLSLSDALSHLKAWFASQE